MKLEIEDLYYKNDNLTINNISFSIRENEFLSIISKNRNIYSALIDSIVYRKNVYTGSIKLDNIELNNLNIENKNIGLISKNPYLRDDLTVYDNIAYPLRKMKIKENIVEEKVDELIKRFGLENIKSLVPKSLSLYQKLKVSLTRTISFKKDILIFDDPLSLIDDNKKEEYIKLINDVYLYLEKPIIIYFDRVISLTKKIITINEDGNLLDNLRKEIIYDYPVNKETFNILNKEEKDLINKEYYLFDAEFNNNLLIVNENKYRLNDIFIKKFINGLDIKYIKLKNDKFISYDKGFSLKFKIDNIIEINDIKIIEFYNNKIVRSINDDYKENSYIYYPIDEIVFLNSNKDRLNTLNDVFESEINCKVLNQYKGLIRVGSSLIDIKKRIDKRIKRLIIKKDSIIDIDLKSGIKIKYIYEIEEFNDFYYARLLLEGMTDTIDIKISKNDIIHQNKTLYLNITEDELKIPLLKI